MQFDNYTQKSLEAVQKARSIALDNNHQQMEQIHLLLALLQVEGALVCHTPDEVRAAVADVPGDQVMVMGGAQIYRLLLDDCDKAYVTRVDAEAEADSFFPDLDRREDWVLDSQSEEKEHEGLRYRFCTYVRK